MESKGEKRAAWHDEDDDLSDERGIRDRKIKYLPKKSVKYENRLNEKFELVHGPTPTWTLPTTRRKNDDADENDDDAEEIQSDRSLARGRLEVENCIALNSDTFDEGYVINSVKFNPLNNIALIAGKNTVNVVRVDGVKNERSLDKIKIPEHNISQAVWSSNGDDIYITFAEQRFKQFSYYNVKSGKVNIVKPNSLTREDKIRKLVPDPSGKIIAGLGQYGKIHLFATSSKELIDTLVMNERVSDVTFDSTRDRMYSYGGNGEVYTWDMTRRECIGKFNDEASLEPLTIARSSSFIACGSASGIVNVYENSRLREITSMRDINVAPTKVLKNLRTPVTSLNINSQGELLAMASSYAEDALRLVHLPSLTVYSNVPHKGFRFGRVNCTDFSPESGYFACGNNKGKAFLFRLKHYSSY